MGVNSLAGNGHPVVIFGVGAAGEATYYACEESGIKVDAFADNNGNRAKELFGLEVIQAERLRDRFTDAQFIISAAAIEDVVPQLQRMGFEHWHPGSLLLKEFDLSGRSYTKSMDLVEHAVETVLFCHGNYLEPGRVYMRSVDLEITEQCSMKCVDCSNLMQYYQQPRSFSLEAVMEWVEALCSNVDEIGEIRVIGGEPFMNPDCSRIVELLAAKPEVRKVVVYTNATIPLKQEHIDRMKHRKVIFMITDYDALSRNHDRVLRVLETNGIRYVSQKARGWTDCAAIGRHHRTEQEQEDLFTNCCANKLYTVLGGRFYRCPFVANAVQLGAVPDFDGDHVDLRTVDAKQQLRKYIFETRFLKACDWCNGRRLSDPEITPAIQIRQPVLYKIQASGA